MKTDRTACVYLSLCMMAYLGFALPLIPIGAEDIRMANVFSIDEADIAAEVRRLCREGILEAPSFKYGGLFYYIPVFALKLWDVVGEVTDRLIIVALRGFCTVAGAGCLWLAYRIGQLAFHPATGAIGVFLVLSTPTFLRWSVEIHPDLPQLFWLLWALYCCCRLCRGFRPKWAVLASLFAGLAFGTKYAGGFLLPVIALAVLLPADGGALSLRAGLRRLGERRYLLVLVAIPAVFVLAFAATNPYAILHFKGFRESLLAEKRIMGFGHALRVDTGWTAWISGLVGTIGTLNAAVLAGCILWGTGYLLRRRRLPAEGGILLVWIGLFMAYLFLEANLKRSRHLLPVLPCVVLFAADAYRRFGGKLLKRISGLPVPRVVLPLLLAVLTWGQIAQAARLFEDRWTRAEKSVELVAGRWLGEQFSAETSILFDAYAYIPGEFQNVYRTIGQSYPMVCHFEPDLLVVREATANHYRNRADAARARMGERAFLDRHYFYRYLREGRIPTYRLLRDFGTVAVYGRAAPRVREKGEPSARWWDLVRRYTGGRAYGMVSARWTMGDIHRSLGQVDEAEREFALAREGKNFAMRIYKHGMRELTAGRFQEAGRAFDAAIEEAAAASVTYRASMQEDLAHRYFDAGYYAEAVVRGEAALALQPDRPGAYFQVSAAYLALGDAVKADSLYAGTVARYGPDARGADCLRDLIHKGISVAGARRALKVYFGGAPP